MRRRFPGGLILVGLLVLLIWWIWQYNQARTPVVVVSPKTSGGGGGNGTTVVVPPTGGVSSGGFMGGPCQAVYVRTAAMEVCGQVTIQGGYIVVQGPGWVRGRFVLMGYAGQCVMDVTGPQLNIGPQCQLYIVPPTGGYGP